METENPKKDKKGAIQEEKTEEFSETDLKVMELVNKRTIHAITNQCVRTDCKPRELYPGLCGDLKGREIQKNMGYIYIHTHLADSLCCMVE